MPATSTTADSSKIILKSTCDKYSKTLKNFFPSNYLSTLNKLYLITVFRTIEKYKKYFLSTQNKKKFYCLTHILINTFY